MNWWLLKLFIALALALGAMTGTLMLVQHLGIGGGFFRLLGVFLSWPTVTGFVAALVLFRLHSALDHLIRRVASMKLPGGVEIQSQAPSTPEPPAPGEGALILSADQQQELRAFIDNLEQQRQLTAAEKERAEQLFQRALVESIFWEFQYLNYFFVPNTKLVLYWISQLPQRRREEFHREWQSKIPDLNEREAILSALRDRGVIEGDGEPLKITPKGYGFLQFIGFIPSAPAPHAPADAR